MIQRISAFLYNRSTFPIAMALTLAMILYASLVMGSQSQCVTDQLADDQSLLGLKFGYDLAFAESVLGSLNESGLVCYKRLMLLWDNLFPLIYCSMYLAWLSVIFGKVFKRKRWPLNLYPIVPAVLDWLENYFEAGLISEFMRSASLEASNLNIASLLTQIKWSASFLNYLLILTGLTLLLVQKRLRRNKN